MNVKQAASWGQDSLAFDLPGFSILLKGLSEKQKVSLQESYKHFIAGEAAAAASQTDVCWVHKVSKLPEVSNEELTRDGQYAPRKLRFFASGGDVVSITGVNFQAQFTPGASRASSFLAVRDEHELAQANVIENYLRIVAAHAALKQGGVVLHSAGLVFDGQAYIFSGRSNAGKTTLTRKAHVIGATVLSDDINLLLPGIEGYRAYAVPFTGEFGRTLDHLGSQDSYPLAGVVLLEQSDSLDVAPVSNSAAVARLLTGCPFVNTDEHESEALFDSVTRMVAEIPVIRLRNRRDDPIEEIMYQVRQGFADTA